MPAVFAPLGAAQCRAPAALRALQVAVLDYGETKGASVTLTKAFSGTSVSFDKSMAAVEKLLGEHGVRESRYTHLRPQRTPKNEFDKATETQGRVVYEFVYQGRGDAERRGVRIAVSYQPEIGPRGGIAGSTQEMAARALFWFLKAKFDSIDYGIEEFDVAFMPHLVTAIGETFAERPALITEAAQRPESIAMLALPSPQ